MTKFVGKLFGIEDLSTIHDWEITFAAPWAQKYPVLLLFAVIGMAILGLVYYFKYQKVARHFGRDLMAVLRAVVLVLLVLILAEPVIRMGVTEYPRPLFLALFDGTDSMNIQDHMTDDAEKDLQAVLGTTDKLEETSRADIVKKVFSKVGQDVLDEIGKEKRVRAYIMDQTDRVREIETASPEQPGELDAAHIAGQISSEGQVTALGNAIRDITRRHKSGLLSGVVIFGDFDKNAGGDPIAAVRELDVPVFTVGIGPTEVVDLGIDLQAPLVLKKDERATVQVHLRQDGLEGQMAKVSLMARRLGSSSGGTEQKTSISVAPVKMVELKKGQTVVDISFLPTFSGRYMLEAKVDSFPEEVLQDNNSAEREITVQDDSLKLYFVEYEPSWEWRFVKEVFYRDPLIGREGFRTFLRSADYKVRKSNEVFVDSLVRSRAEFFDNDVILLSDVPSEMLSEKFQDMLEEYVKQFGGGLVVIAGPQFGLGELNNTRIADMLPVVVDPTSKAKVSDFRLELTPKAADFDFMNLGDDERENRQAWSTMGRLPWFQPVLRPHPLANVLATHPSERCVDEKTLQPVIATRRYGKGEVVYIGFNEMWRLRKKHGEKFYRQFWGQMIYRLGLGRALGSQKRFAVSTDRPVYQSGDQIRVTVEAYNLNFETLNVPKLNGRLVASDEDEGGAPIQTLVSIPKSRGENVYETTIPVYASGMHRLLVRDPSTGDEVEANFKVAPISVERRSAARNLNLQQLLAAETGGKSYELHQLAGLAGDVPNLRVEETSEHRFDLWNTKLILWLLIILMLSEWLTRKLMNLR